jgi:hypothetical protein
MVIKLEVFPNSWSYLAKISFHGVSILMKAQLAGWWSLRTLVDSRKATSMPSAVWLWYGDPWRTGLEQGVGQRKILWPSRLGGLSWDWYSHLLNPELSRNPGNMEVMTRQRTDRPQNYLSAPSKLSPNSILHPPSPHWASILARKDSDRVLKICVLLKTGHNSETA